jgi:glycosyltransferase involved in cell wall biosynthesis
VPASVSVVLPVFNERDVIDDVVRKTSQALARHAGGGELIAVDDGSTDGSGELLDRLAATLPRLRVIHFPRNRGYGEALRAGFHASSEALVLFMDSDDQFDPDELGLLLPLADRADVIIGYRHRRADGALRLLLSQGYNWMVRRALAVQARDVNCAFKMIRRDRLRELDLTMRGYLINAELLAKAAARDLTIVEVAVHHQPRRAGRSKVGVADIPRTAAQLLSLAWSLRRGSL